MDNSPELKQMQVAGIVLDQKSNNPVVILKDPESLRALPIWVGSAEASAIASSLNNLPFTRPMTHDLFAKVIAELDAKVASVCITDLVEGTYFATLEIQSEDLIKEVDARPSDAIALALRLNIPIYVSESILDQSQVTLLAVDRDQVGNMEISEEELLAAEGLENFQNIDKNRWSEILAEMEPSDFKYKQ